ncbi:MAG: hypothetical protein JXA74_17580, partial [Anaerolineae bacterium]|nr:hypothetical protein [Anaerolineae bacterium]
MIVIRYTYKPSDDVFRARDLWVEWRNTHPEENWRVYNSITGDQQVLVVERLFENEDPASVAYHLFDPSRQERWAAEPGFREWSQKWQGIEVQLATRELWRL